MSDTSSRAVVDRIYEHFAAGNVPGIISTLSEEIDWIFHGPPALPFAGHFQGHEGALRFFGAVAETVVPERFEPREFIVAGEKVVVLGSETVLVKATGRRFDTDWVHVFTVRDGRIVSVREFYDTATMLEAFDGRPAGSIAESPTAESPTAGSPTAGSPTAGNPAAN